MHHKDNCSAGGQRRVGNARRWWQWHREADSSLAHENDLVILQSLAGDGDFARHCHERGAAKIIAKMEECLKAASAAGDVVDMPVNHDLRRWFARHLAGMLAFNSLHDPPMSNTADCIWI